MRLFCGLSLAYEVRRNLELLLEHLRPKAALHWTPPANLHITTKFIGEWPEERGAELRETLTRLGAGRTIRLAVRGLGWFPNPHHPRFLFAGVEKTAELEQLAADTARALTGVGIPEETKPYLPHVTLARIKGEPDLAPVRAAIASLPSADFGAYTAAKHLLYRSRVGPEGSVYSVEAEFPL
jgi:2'-5' RNA ligase